MGGVTTPKWLDDLIWSGKPLDPSTITYPEDPPGVLGPNTIRRWRRLMAPLNAENHYRPVAIEFSPTDWPAIQHALMKRAEVHLPLDGEFPTSWAGMRLGVHEFLPAGFIKLEFADGRVELGKLNTGRANAG